MAEIYVQLYDRGNTTYLRESYEHDLSKRAVVTLHYTPSGSVLQTCVSKGTNEVMDAVVLVVDYIRRNGLP